MNEPRNLLKILTGIAVLALLFAVPEGADGFLRGARRVQNCPQPSTQSSGIRPFGPIRPLSAEIEPFLMGFPTVIGNFGTNVENLLPIDVPDLGNGKTHFYMWGTTTDPKKMPVEDDPITLYDLNFAAPYGTIKSKTIFTSANSWGIRVYEVPFPLEFRFAITYKDTTDPANPVIVSTSIGGVHCTLNKIKK